MSILIMSQTHNRTILHLFLKVVFIKGVQKSLGHFPTALI